MGMAYICINIIYDFAEVLTKFLTCGKCKSPGRTAVAQLSLLLCLGSVCFSIFWDAANAQQAKGARIIIALLAIHIASTFIFLALGFFFWCNCTPPNTDGFIKILIFCISLLHIICIILFIALRWHERDWDWDIASHWKVVLEASRFLLSVIMLLSLKELW